MKIGIDLSCRSIEGVLIDNGIIKRFIQKPIYFEKRESKKNVMNSLYTVIEELINSEVKTIGISLPSQINPEQGIIYDLELIPHWKGLRIQRIIMEKYRIPVYIGNDVNCMALGEKYYGHGKCYSNILCIHLDENIGTSCIINNHLCIYSKDTYENIDCLSQSHYHCIRSYRMSYLRAIEELRYYRKKFPDEIREPEHEIWREIGIVMGRLISIFINDFEPQFIVLTGYFENSFIQLQKTIKDYMAEFNKSHKDIYRIIVPGNGQEMKSLGASMLIPGKSFYNAYSSISNESLVVC